MKSKLITDVLAWLLAGFFLLGATMNAMGGAETIGDYARWGYPNWFHYVTAALEVVTAVLLVLRPLRRSGSLLGAAIMAAAAATLLRHGEVAHAFAPMVVLAACLALTFLTLRTRP